MNGLFRSIAVGVACAIALCVVAFALAPFFDTVGVYTAPFALIAPVLDKVVPESVINIVDRLMPVAGPAAGVALILGCTLACWTVVFSTFYFVWTQLRRRLSAKRAVAKS